MYERSYYDGNLPFHQRTDVQTAHTELTGALQRVRDRIDAEYGPQDWTNIETLNDRGTGYCRDRKHEGREDARHQGWTFTLRAENFERIKGTVIEEVAPLGFTEVVDISDEKVGWVDVYNPEDGGYVSLMLSEPGHKLSLYYTTGCRPEATVPSAAPPS